MFSLLGLYSCGGGETTKEGEDKSADSKSASEESPLLDYSSETAENKSEREQMIAVAKEGFVNQGLPEFKLNVNYLKVKGKFAFLKAEAKNADGSDYVPKEETPDCCHVEAFLRKDDGKWINVACNAFATDVWYACLWKEKNAPKEIFDTTEGGCTE